MKKTGWMLLALLGTAIVIGVSTPARADTSSVTLAWTANTEPDLAGYKVYQGTAAGGSYVLKATLGKVTTHTLSGLADGTYYFVVTAYDTSALESGYSNEVTKTLDTLAPAAPSSLTITITVSVK